MYFDVFSHYLPTTHNVVADGDDGHRKINGDARERERAVAAGWTTDATEEFIDTLVENGE